LEINSSGPLSYEALEAWYLRYGFKHWKGIYRREPKDEKAKAQEERREASITYAGKTTQT